MGQQIVAFNHYRRCHVCSSVTEKAERIQRCDGCGKSVIPFFYFDESVEEVPSAEKLRHIPTLGKMHPLWGLTAVWSPNETDESPATAS